MTQINGSYRLCRELYDMMIPIRDAGTVLVLTPGSPEHSQVIYYGAERITSVQPVPYGGFSLSLFDGETLASNICAHVDLQPAREPARQSQSPEVPEVTPQMDAQTLSRGSLFLLERVDAGTGERLGWIRVFEQALDQWVQWTQNNEIQCQMLTGQLLEQLLERQWKGVGI